MVQLEVVDDSFPTLVTAFGGAVESIQQFKWYNYLNFLYIGQVEEYGIGREQGEYGIGREQGNKEGNRGSME
jgi:hypothetical protein